MLNPLEMKLRGFGDIDDEDVRRLDNLCIDVRSYRGKTDLIKEGDRPEGVFVLIEGWAYRYKVLADGGRQIMAFLVPGDLCDIHVFILKEMDHSIGLLGDAKVALIPKQKMLDLLDERPRLARALWWSTLVDEGILRAWIVNMGQRDAYKRIGHLFAELWFRLKAVHRTRGASFEMPLTQADLGDTLGLTSVHVNRMLQRMRSEGLIELSGSHMRIPDVERLIAASGFEPNYLHLEPRPA